MKVSGTHGAAGWRGDIQGLRAIAVGLVIAGHAGLAGFSGGYVGVDVFFVLSGFLITGLLLRESDSTGRVSIPGFYARRARRILPAATLVLIAVLAYAATAYGPLRLGQIVGDARWAAVFLANVHFAALGTDYFAPTTPSPFQHFWSLAVEEQFYLLWPLLVLLLARRLGRPRLRLLIAALGLASLAWSLHETATNPAAAYFNTPARAYELLAGALLAATPVVLRRGRWVATALGLGLLAYAVVTFDSTSAFPGWRGLVPTVATCALLLAGTGGRHPVLASRPMIFLGDISYSLYLWHWPILVIWPHQNRTLAVAETVVAATLTYYLVEQPFRTGRFWKPRLASLAIWPAALALVAVGTVGANAYAGHLADERAADADAWWKAHPADSSSTLSESIQQAVDNARSGAPVPPGLSIGPGWNQTYSCYSKFRTTLAPVCSLGDATATRTVVLTGDSQAGMWLAAFDQWGQRTHVRVVPFVKTGCSMYDVVQPSGKEPAGNCPAFRTWARAQIAALHPEAIVVTARGALAVSGSGGLSADQVWQGGVTRGLTLLKPDTARLIVLGSLPALPFDPANCISAPGTPERDCLATSDTAEVRSNAATAAAARAVGARYVDPVPLACTPGGECPSVIGMTVVWHDDAHLTQAWVRTVEAALMPLLGPPFASRTPH